jgi:twitching motility protein PilT
MDMISEVENRGVETQWPEVFTDTVSRGAGLIVFSGTRESQMELMNDAIIQAKPRASIVSVEKINSNIKDADVVVYHGTCDTASTLELMNLAEEGRLVVQTVMAPSVISSLHKVFSQLGAQPHLIWRYVDQLTLMLNQMKLKDLNNKEFIIHEVVLATPGIKKNLLSSQVDEIESVLKENKEDQGMVSFNQTLLKLLIRRKIDLKTAFQRTRDPENLDLLLKRVGI